MTYSPFIHTQSLLALLLLYTGVYLRRKRTAHVATMVTTIVFDLAIIAQIELNQGAVDKASRFVSNPAILNVHVTLAISYVLLLIPVVYTGLGLLRGKNFLRSYHKRLALIVVPLRTLVFITSFWVTAT